MKKMLLEEELDQLYPSSDGVEMGESVRHINLMTFLYENLLHHFLGQSVAVHADLFWYPVEGKPKIRRAPDIMVILDCEMAERKSYRQWLEGGKPATMVIEILSDSNTPAEMKTRRAWYQKYKVGEYYEIEEENDEVSVWLLQGGKLIKQKDITSFVSPATGIRFDWSSEHLQVYTPDGMPFINGHEVRQALQEARRQHTLVQEEARRQLEQTQEEARRQQQQAEEEMRRQQQQAEEEMRRQQQQAEERIAELQRQLDELRNRPDA